MKCPSCKEVNLAMSERSGVEIDYCPQCRGVWLDRGELDKIIEKVNHESKPTPANNIPHQQPTQHSHYQQDYYKHKRKKSFLEEIFD